MTIIFLAIAALALLAPDPAFAQERSPLARPPAATLSASGLAHLPAVQVPDSVRRRVGYQHWQGAAIGAGAGAVAGLLLGLAARDICVDCAERRSGAALVSLAGAGLGGAFGFLVGSATPRYRWVAPPPPDSRATTPP